MVAYMVVNACGILLISCNKYEGSYIWLHIKYIYPQPHACMNPSILEQE